MSGEGRLLIIESNPGALIVARNMLAREGYEVITAPEVADGIAKAQATPPDVLLLDGSLAEPAMLQTLLRERPSPLPLILLVPKGLGPAILETLGLEALDVLLVEVVEKPFLADQLNRAVKKALIGEQEIVADEASGPDTLDAELTCQVLSIVDVLGDPSTTSSFSALPALATSRAGWLASRIHEMLPDPPERLALEHACEVALEEEEIFGRIPEADGEKLMSGRIGTLSVEQVLQFAEPIPSTVSIHFQRGEQTVQVFFRERSLFFARQTNLPAVFALGRFLVDLEAIDQDTLTGVVLDNAHSSQLLGELLLERGLVSREQLDTALQRQTEELVFEILRWKRGRFVVTSNPAIPEEAELAGISYGVTPLLMEGLRRLDEWNQAVAEIRAADAVPTRVSGSGEEKLDQLTTTQRFMLRAIDGTSTVGDIVARSRRPVFDVWRALQDLRASELVTLEER